MEKTRVKDFTEGNITKQLILFSLPLFMSNLLQVVYNMVDMIVVGKVLGKVGTSAVAVGGDVSNLLTFIAMGFSSAGQVLIAKLIGRGEREKLGKFVGTMSGFLLVCALAVSVVGIACQGPLLSVMNTPKESYEGAKSYATVCMCGMVFIYGYNVVSAILRGMGDSKSPFIFITIGAVLNIILDVVFVVFLSMGAFGAGLATVISQAVSFLSCTVFLVKKRKEYYLNVNGREFFRWDRQMLGALVKLGTPMAIKTASIQVSKLFVNSWINSYGVAVSAFAGIANKVSSIANLISQAMNTAGSTMVGQNIASGKNKRVAGVLIRLAGITLTVSTVMSLAIVLFPTQIFGIFTKGSDGDVLAIAKGFVPIAILLFFGSSLRSVMNAFLNGSGNVKVNFATAIFDGIIMRIGLSLLFGLAVGMKHYGFWLGDAIAGFTPFFIGIVYYFFGKWKKSDESEKE